MTSKSRPASIPPDHFQTPLPYQNPRTNSSCLYVMLYITSQTCNSQLPMPMADLQLQAVLDFFRRNGLSTCESALITDVHDKSNSDFHSLLLPPLRIPTTAARTSDDATSDDEFLSAGSFSTDLHSSDFPYGNEATQPSSEGSSPRSSQFGTARAYSDFDRHNDLFWYEEDDKDFAMPPLYGDREFDGDPSEDKFMMFVQARESARDDLKNNLISEARSALESKENFKDQYCNGFNDLSSDFSLEKSGKKFEDHTGSTCLACLCACCCGASRGEIDDPGAEDLKLTNVSDVKPQNLDTVRDLNGLEEDRQLNANKYVVGTNGVMSGDVVDELSTHDEYEVFNLRIIHRRNRTGFEENKELPIVLNSIIAGRYYVTEFIGSAAFSRVIQAHDLCSGMDVCLKIIKNDKDFFDQSLDEIKLLKYVNKHDPFDEHHILRLFDYFYHQEHLFIVTELLRANLYEFHKYSQESGGEPYFTLPKLQIVAQQCLEALLYLHGLGIIHCDLKPENILIKSYRRCEIKVIDLGSSCFQTDTLSFYIQSRSYRAPEVILGLPYDHKIDLWSLGCILAELYSGDVLFPNEAVVTILARVMAVLGPIDIGMLLKGQETHKYFTNEYDLYYMHEDTNEVEYIVPDEMSLEDHLQISDPLFVDFLKYLLEINPERRPTAREALEHPWLCHSYSE